MGKLDGRVAIVTGAAYGERAALGAVYAKALAEAGASVVLSDTKECEPVVEDIHATGGKALGLTTDVTDEAQIQEMVARSISEFGRVEANDMVETGMDDHIALSVEKSADLVQYMRDNSISYWDRLLADRPLYQVFVRDPNGVILELNDYDPEIDKLEPMVILGQD